LDNDQIVTIRIDKYLQNNGSTRNKNGLAAKDAIIGAMVAETKTSWAVHTFNIDGWPIGKDQLQLTLVQSSGGDVGLHVSTDVKKFANFGKGVFFASGSRHAYVVPPPAGAGKPKG